MLYLYNKVLKLMLKVPMNPEKCTILFLSRKKSSIGSFLPREIQNLASSLARGHQVLVVLCTKGPKTLTFSWQRDTKLGISLSIETSECSLSCLVFDMIRLCIRPGTLPDFFSESDLMVSGGSVRSYFKTISMSQTVCEAKRSRRGNHF